MKNIIEECYQESVKLLKKNSCEFGLLASSPQKRAVARNYLSVFSRDSSICALGMVASGDKELIRTAKLSLLTLAKHQAENGQIPNYVKPGDSRVDFWRLGCIDATLWWLIALKFYDEKSGDRKLYKRLEKNIGGALNWLDCQKHNEDELLMQGEASDWADIMPRSGKVLYSNALWYQVAKLYKLKNLKKIKKSFNDCFYPFDKKASDVSKCERATVGEIKKSMKKVDNYLSFVGYLKWGEGVNVYANNLSVIFGLGDKKFQKKILENFLSQKRREELAIPVLFNPIKQHSKLWSKYMESHNQNFPSQYHNGGVWLFASCFFVIALAKSGMKKEAWIELEKIAELNARNKWQFNEWFNAKTGEASGMHYQSWNAGMFLKAYHVLKGDIKI